MGKILGAIGRFAKGKVSIIGGVLTALGLGTGGGDVVADCASKLLDSPDSAAAAVGALVLLFGVARKAGWVGATNGTR